MKTRPLSLTIIGWIFVVANAVAALFHAYNFIENTQATTPVLSLLYLVASILGLLAGILLLRLKQLGGFLYAFAVLYGWILVFTFMRDQAFTWLTLVSGVVVPAIFGSIIIRNWNHLSPLNPSTLTGEDSHA